ncbi:uncharacterized protein LOC106880282 isoform X1 [Octopus bimaculoides]|uniref:MARVEL domain-containing protein n=1 Tax=Octopus bimaculoides TaxID=37653 RepID=A0A0L8FYU3_OCTBM|nr:uncharacterized protein LOC106880282 isoform X1 [Octopus bimaculoides]|eukprot:XP_014785639.1 PREDICTED: uncharacterized protein LOC106880282 isoform X1 [Octopus bimaculoides]
MTCACVLASCRAIQRNGVQKIETFKQKKKQQTKKKQLGASNDEGESKTKRTLKIMGNTLKSSIMVLSVLLAVLLQIISLVLPYWEKIGNNYAGLWIICDEVECHTKSKGLAHLTAFQFLEVTGMFLAAIACAVLSLGSYNFISIEKLILILVTLFILAGSAITVGMFIHGVNVLHLHFCYIISSTGAAFFFFLAGVIISYNSF